MISSVINNIFIALNVIFCANVPSLTMELPLCNLVRLDCVSNSPCAKASIAQVFAAIGEMKLTDAHLRKTVQRLNQSVGLSLLILEIIVNSVTTVSITS